MQNSSYDGRARRTLNEAFGPYTSRDFHEVDPPGYPAGWWAAMVVVAVLSLIAIVVTS